MSRKLIGAVVGLTYLAMAGPANAAFIAVDALGNDWGASGADTGMSLDIGDTLWVDVATDDCWSAGAPPRDSNADGLMVIDNNSCQVGNSTFGDYTDSGLAAPFGSLVGTIGGGNPFLIGTHFDAPVSESGALLLWYWDSRGSDNSGFITADVQVHKAPEPAALGFLGLGLALIGYRARRRKLA